MTDEEVKDWRRVIEGMVPVGLCFNDHDFAVLARDAEDAEMLKRMLRNQSTNYPLVNHSS